MHTHRHYRRITIFFILFVAAMPVAADDPPAITPIRIVHDMLEARTSSFITHPTFADFSVCYGNTCRYIATLGLGQEEQERIRGLFNATDLSPEEERARIRDAVATLERITGDKTGTSADRGENLNSPGQAGQMDCVDESTNTTVYLTMLQVDHLLRWHAVEPRTSRGLGSLQVPHFTAVIRDMNDNMRYAVDSWFLDNGEPPFIVPLTIWWKGWRPQSADTATAGNENNK